MNLIWNPRGYSYYLGSINLILIYFIFIPFMSNLIRFILIFFSAVTIIFADAIIKKISLDQTFFDVLKNPWVILVYGLYLVQIFCAILIFIFWGEIAIYSNLFVVLYGILGVVIGILFFKESVSMIQMVGIGLGLVGAVLMNLK